ncbi:VWA domain-containing protein [Flavihumibacter sp. RY-1]|uniref:VWA domain-containing protein n=1 Tax=Flavihumibacter fluminis TaxID=2909236 RepID=A0ABS9BFG5_9BACT|nr:VWA domain-containing protein [Flavihumibacter fluminis]MCF1714347.1 VWA domain-containing protein [Flavihumibacter fluminis]
MHSTGYLFYSGASGGFGITSAKAEDSVTLSLDGYKVSTFLLKGNKENSLVLPLLVKKASQPEKRLMSLARDIKPAELAKFSVGGETYSSLRENDYMEAAKFPTIDFAVNTDKASYSNIRRFINMGSTVPPDAVRIEEMLNYFALEYEQPEAGQDFSIRTSLSECPWRPANQLFYVKLSARKLDMAQVPPSNLVFLIDVSGSMDMPNRLPLLKTAFKLMVNNLRPIDTISIVVYGGTVGVWLQPTSGVEKEKINKSIEELSPGGSTAGESGILAAYRLAESTFIPNGNNRVVLATDGDFNVGQTSEEALERMIVQQRQKGIYLTCLGVGMGNYKDSKLEVLAKKGNGNFAYLDNEKEAEKVLVKELTQTMYSVADDALLHVSFYPANVKNYRLIGFDNKFSALSAEGDGLLEGGEVGSGHTLMAIFELTPAEKYDSSAALAKIELSYKHPNDSLQQKLIREVTDSRIQSFQTLPYTYRMAAGITLFGSVLKESRFVKPANLQDVLTIINPISNQDDLVQQELIALVEKAKKIYYKGKASKLKPNLFW